MISIISIGMHLPCFMLLLLSRDLHDEPFMFVCRCGRKHARAIVYGGGRVTVGSVAKSGLGGVRDANVNFFIFAFF